MLVIHLQMNDDFHDLPYRRRGRSERLIDTVPCVIVLQCRHICISLAYCSSLLNISFSQSTVQTVTSIGRLRLTLIKHADRKGSIVGRRFSSKSQSLRACYPGLPFSHILRHPRQNVVVPTVFFIYWYILGSHQTLIARNFSPAFRFSRDKILSYV